jgi:glyoxylase-like metal-dependent hydrolase (beta-lactamase superfamily II)
MFSTGAYYITQMVLLKKPYDEKRDSVQLKYIFETHFHADFVSGHVDLSRETGAAIFLVQMLFANLTVLLQQTGNTIETSK